MKDTPTKLDVPSTEIKLDHTLTQDQLSLLRDIALDAAALQNQIVAFICTMMK